MVGVLHCYYYKWYYNVITSDYDHITIAIMYQLLVLNKFVLILYYDLNYLLLILTSSYMVTYN